GQDGRDAQLLTQKRRRRIDRRHVHEDPRAKRDAVEGTPIAPQGGLRFGAADQVVPRALVQPAARLTDELLVADVIQSHRPMVGRSADSSAHAPRRSKSNKAPVTGPRARRRSRLALFTGANASAEALGGPC